MVLHLRRFWLEWISNLRKRSSYKWATKEVVSSLFRFDMDGLQNEKQIFI
jgi:hypothetical protein